MDAALEGFAEMGSLSCAHVTLQQESQATLVLKLLASYTILTSLQAELSSVCVIGLWSPDVRQGLSSPTPALSASPILYCIRWVVVSF